MKPKILNSLKEPLEDDICIHIFTVSAAMVGVCLTVIGLFRIVVELKNISSLADDILAIDALVFLVACLVSYAALRSRGKRRRIRMERAADLLFLSGLCLMVFICVVIAYSFF